MALVRYYCQSVPSHLPQNHSNQKSFSALILLKREEQRRTRLRTIELDVISDSNPLHVKKIENAYFNFSFKRIPSTPSFILKPQKTSTLGLQ